MSELSDKDACIAYAKAWNSFDCGSFVELLQDDAVYSSVNLKKDIIGKDKISNFLTERFEKINRPEQTIFVDVGRTSYSPPIRDCALMCKNSAISRIVFFDLKGDHIQSFKTIHEFAYGAKATNSFPGLNGDATFRIRNFDEYDPDKAKLAKNFEGKICLFHEKYIYSLVRIKSVEANDHGVRVNCQWIDHMGGIPHNSEGFLEVSAAWELFYVRNFNMGGSYGGWSICSDTDIIDKLKEYSSQVDVAEDPRSRGYKMAMFMGTLPEKGRCC